MVRRPPRSPLFPPTTLSRSEVDHEDPGVLPAARRVLLRGERHVGEPAGLRRRPEERRVQRQPAEEERSEEHTSELQSRQYLVCRLLLEKKKNKHRVIITRNV